MRLFIAIQIKSNPEISNVIQVIKENQGDCKITYSHLHNLHITLAFLGETSKSKINELTQIINSIAQNHKSFKLILKGLGNFNRKSIPGVIWIGVEPSNNLEKLWKELDQSLVNSKFLESHSTFTPHLTLCRIKKYSSQSQILDSTKQFEQLPFGETEVAEIILYQSILKETGPEYKPIEIFKLKN